MEFEMAVKGQPASIKWGYWAALSHYRCHNHCRGLEDDDNFLRRLCEMENGEWETAKPIIFGGFFQLDVNNLWQHARAAEDYREDCATYERNVKRGKHANEARWRKKRK